MKHLRKEKNKFRKFLDDKITDFITYLKNTKIKTIIADALAYLVVLFLIVYPIVSIVLFFYFGHKQFPDQIPWF